MQSFISNKRDEKRFSIIKHALMRKNVTPGALVYSITFVVTQKKQYIVQFVTKEKPRNPTYILKAISFDRTLSSYFYGIFVLRVNEEDFVFLTDVSQCLAFFTMCY